MSDYKEGPMSLVEGAKISKGNVSAQTEATGLSATEATVTMTNRMVTPGSVGCNATGVETFSSKQYEVDAHKSGKMQSKELLALSPTRRTSSAIKYPVDKPSIKRQRFIDEPEMIILTEESIENKINAKDQTKNVPTHKLSQIEGIGNKKEQFSPEVLTVKNTTFQPRVAEVSKNSDSKVLVGIFPNSAYDKTDKILSFIQYQNDGLNVDKWKILRRTNKSTNALVVLLIDQESSAKLRKNESKIFYRFRQIKLQLKNNDDKTIEWSSYDSLNM